MAETAAAKTAGEAEETSGVRELLDYGPETGLLTWKWRDQTWFNSEPATGEAVAGRSRRSVRAGPAAGCNWRA